MKHALHNTISDINKSKEVTDKVTGESKTIKVRDGHAIQMANAKIKEIRQGFVDWLGRTPDIFKQQLSDRYNHLFNCFVRPNFDGTHQTFPDLDLRRLSIADLYKSQKEPCGCSKPTVAASAVTRWERARRLSCVLPIVQKKEGHVYHPLDVFFL